jgi:hypothetical protein
MEKKEVVEELKEALRTNSHLRHRLGIDEGSGGPDVLEDGETIAFTNKDGEDWFVQVQGA